MKNTNNCPPTDLTNSSFIELVDEEAVKTVGGSNAGTAGAALGSAVIGASAGSSGRSLVASVNSMIRALNQ